MYVFKKHFWENLTKRDGLIIVKFLSSSIFQFQCVKFLLVLYLLVQISCQLIQIYLFLYELNTQQFIQYSPVFCFMFYGILAVIILLTDPRIIEDLFDEMVILPIDEATETTKLKIKKEMKIVSIFTICNTTGVICVAITFYFCNAYDYNMLLMAKYFTDYWPEYQNILTNIYKLFLTFAIATVYTAHCYQVIYYTQHSKYQLWMLIDQIDGITESENGDSFNENLVDDVGYQQRVKARWINYVKRSEEIRGPGNMKINQISNYIICFAFCGLLAIVSISYAVLSMKTSTFSYDYRYIPTGTLMVLMTSSSVLLAGQSIETVNENLHEKLKQMEWYKMSIENRKFYLIVLSVTQRDVRIKFSENYSINYALGLAIVRATYSVLSVLASLQDTFN